MKVAYLDCFSGISGDMLLGALVDLGVNLEELKEAFNDMGLKGFEITSRRVSKQGVSGTKVDVIVKDDQPHRHLSDIMAIVESSTLNPGIKQGVRQVFNILAAAEVKIHNCHLEQVHFHEVGAVDAIVDVVGTLIGINKLNIERVYCSPLNLGSGTVNCAHGLLPVPAPATAEVLLEIPVYSQGPAVELVTPTGAALVKYLSAGFGVLPPMVLKAVGYGAGQREGEIPNLLRIMVGWQEHKHSVHRHNHHHAPIEMDIN